MNWNNRLFKQVKQVCYPATFKEVERTAALALSARLNIQEAIPVSDKGEGLHVCLSSSYKGNIPAALPEAHPWIYITVDQAGNGILVSSEPALLYAACSSTLFLSQQQADQVEQGLLLTCSFSRNRPLFDSCLNQVARTARGFEPESYIEQVASSGFTHLEVNGLAMHLAYEPRVAGEYYSQFYAYGSGLMQFVDSSLTRGLYDPSLLQANMQRMKKMAALGRRYGLKPGMFCFEPRTLPERFFQQYPTLRGARVDHPLRSHMPRYTLAQDHPVVREHYRELMHNIMEAIPDLDYLSLWTNDSGSGFEHTSSLYAGRNGGPYIIREWKTHEEIAQAAGESAVRWLRLLQETGAKINPNFQVSLRIESFKAEHDTIIQGMGQGLTIEAPSLLVYGYDLPYSHPNLPENKGIAGTMFHLNMDPKERDVLASCRTSGFEPEIHYAPSSTFNMEPLLGIPYPGMLHKKLRALHETGVRHINAIGGLLHVDKTPYWPNPHVIRAFQLTPSAQLHDILHQLATEWVGPAHAESLTKAWRLTEEAITYIPYVPLFSNFGYVWYRLWIRPFVPDIEAIPDKDRAYYERFMVTMANNPNMNDLGKDVLFELITESSGAYMTAAFDQHVEPRFDLALAFIEEQLVDAEFPGKEVFDDLYVRVQAAKIWAITLRNVCSWVHNVYGFLRTTDADEKQAFITALQSTIDKDLQNTRDLLRLWSDSETEFMLVAEPGETCYIYGENFGELLVNKIALTEKYRSTAPFIDRDIIWRITPNHAAYNRDS